MPEIASIPWKPHDAGRWRLLVDGPCDGPTNMAIDEVLALACARGWSSPSLRLYRWAVPTVSLGYNQPMRGEMNHDRCVEHGIPLVRRPTGGRALLHHHELTYSLAVPIPYGNRNVLQDYRWISHCLLLALKRLGVVAALSRGTRIPDEAGGLCFLSSSRYELTVNGRKVLGSAQRRFSGALLQHGSLLVDIDDSLWTTLFPQARALRARATGLKSLLGRSPDWEELVWAVRGGFAEGATVSLEPGELTLREQSLVEGLVASRYGTPEWTARR